MNKKIKGLEITTEANGKSLAIDPNIVGIEAEQISSENLQTEILGKGSMAKVPAEFSGLNLTPQLTVPDANSQIVTITPDGDVEKSTVANISVFRADNTSGIGVPFMNGQSFAIRDIVISDIKHEGGDVFPTPTENDNNKVLQFNALNNSFVLAGSSEAQQKIDLQSIKVDYTPVGDVYLPIVDTILPFDNILLFPIGDFILIDNTIQIATAGRIIINLNFTGENTDPQERKVILTSERSLDNGSTWLPIREFIVDVHTIDTDIDDEQWTSMIETTTPNELIRIVGRVTVGATAVKILNISLSVHTLSGDVFVKAPEFSINSINKVELSKSGIVFTIPLNQPTILPDGFTLFTNLLDDINPGDTIKFLNTSALPLVDTALAEDSIQLEYHTGTWEVILIESRKGFIEKVGVSNNNIFVFNPLSIKIIDLRDGLKFDFFLDLPVSEQTTFRGTLASTQIFFDIEGVNYPIYRENLTLIDASDSENYFVDGFYNNGSHTFTKCTFKQSLNGGNGGFVVRIITEDTGNLGNILTFLNGWTYGNIRTRRHNGVLYFSITQLTGTASSTSRIFTFPHGFNTQISIFPSCENDVSPFEIASFALQAVNFDFTGNRLSRTQVSGAELSMSSILSLN